MESSTCIKIAFSLIILFTTNCKKPESPDAPSEQPSKSYNTGVPYTPPIVTFNSNIQGVVKTLKGDVVTNAKVEAGDKVVYTDGNGVFEISKADFTDDFCYIKVTKQGFFTGSTTVYGEKNKTSQTQVFIRPLKNLNTFTANQKKSIILSTGAKVQFTSGVFITKENKKYEGQVYVYAEHLNPDDELFSLTIPGRDLRAFDNEGNDALLYSYGMLDVEIYDEAGSKLQLAPNSFAELTFPVSAKMLASAPKRIPLWYFDENMGVWIEEGEAELVGNSYIGTVTHFTPHNVDKRVTAPRRRREVVTPPPSPFSPPPPPPAVGSFRGSLVNCQGRFEKFGVVRIGQTTFTADIFGNFIGVLPFGNYDIALYDNINNKFIALDKKVNIVQRETQVDIGTVKLPCRASIVAEINECNNAFNGYAVLEYQNKKQVILITDGVLQAEVPSTGQAATLTFYKNASGALRIIPIELPKTETPLDLAIINTCTDIDWTKEAKFSFLYTENGEDKEYEMKDFYYAKATFNDLDDITTIKLIDKNLMDSVKIVFIGNEETSVSSPVGLEEHLTPKVYININTLDLNRESKNIVLDVIDYQIGGWIFGMCNGIFVKETSKNGTVTNPASEFGDKPYIKDVVFSVEAK